MLGASAAHLPGHAPRPIDPDALSGLRWDASAISALTGLDVRVYRSHSRVHGWTAHGGFDVVAVYGSSIATATLSDAAKAEAYLHGLYAGLAAATALATAALTELGDPGSTQ